MAIIGINKNPLNVKSPLAAMIAGFASVLSKKTKSYYDYRYTHDIIMGN